MKRENKVLLQSIALTSKLVLKSLISRKNYRGLKIVHDHNSMELMGTSIAMFLRVSCFELVIVDDHFYEMDESSQEFILAHEYGHSIDKDLGVGGLDERNKKRIEASINGEVIREEAFADDIGLEAVGYEKAINALEEIRFLLPVFGRDEIEARITRLLTKLEGGK